MEFYCLCPSPLGDILLISDGEALRGLFFADHHGTEGLSLREDLPVFEKTRVWLGRYFNGEAPEPGDIPISLRGSPFALSVWEELKKIPYGATVSYGDIARAIGCRSAQAVGGAVGRNPISIIVPCHRVIGSDGRMVGYAGGMERKSALLELEGSSVLF